MTANLRQLRYRSRLNSTLCPDQSVASELIDQGQRGRELRTVQVA